MKAKARGITCYREAVAVGSEEFNRLQAAHDAGVAITLDDHPGRLFLVGGMEAVGTEVPPSAVTFGLFEAEDEREAVTSPEPSPGGVKAEQAVEDQVLDTPPGDASAVDAVPVSKRKR